MEEWGILVHYMLFLWLFERQGEIVMKKSQENHPEEV